MGPISGLNLHLELINLAIEACVLVRTLRAMQVQHACYYIGAVNKPQTRQQLPRFS